MSTLPHAFKIATSIGARPHMNGRREETEITHPKNARSLLVPVVSAPAGSSGTCSSSSVGKYEVSVMDLRRGMKGASI